MTEMKIVQAVAAFFDDHDLLHIGTVQEFSDSEELRESAKEAILEHGSFYKSEDNLEVASYIQEKKDEQE